MPPRLYPFSLYRDMVCCPAKEKPCRFVPVTVCFYRQTAGTFSIDRAEEGFEMHNRTNTKTNTTPADNGAHANDVETEVQALITRVPSQKKRMGQHKDLTENKIRETDFNRVLRIF